MKKRIVRLFPLVLAIVIFLFVMIFCPYNSKVDSLSIDFNDNSLTISWNQINNIDGYEVLFKESDRNFVIIDVKSNTLIFDSKFLSKISEIKVRTYTYDSYSYKVYGPYSTIEIS